MNDLPTPAHVRPYMLKHSMTEDEYEDYLDLLHRLRFCENIPTAVDLVYESRRLNEYIKACETVCNHELSDYKDTKSKFFNGPTLLGMNTTACALLDKNIEEYEGELEELSRMWANVTNYIIDMRNRIGWILPKGFADDTLFSIPIYLCPNCSHRQPILNGVIVCEACGRRRVTPELIKVSLALSAARNKAIFQIPDLFRQLANKPRQTCPMCYSSQRGQGIFITCKECGETSARG